MHEGAISINKEGSILFCNSCFAHMVNLHLEKTMGTKYEKYLDNSLKESIKELINPGGVNTLKTEGIMKSNDGNTTPVLLTINTLILYKLFVLNIILTDLAIQNENQERLKAKTKIIEEKNKELALAA